VTFEVCAAMIFDPISGTA